MPSVAPDHARPLVTAVLVVNDGEDWLPSTLHSLESQVYPDLRLVVVDNGSRDGSQDILAERVPPENVITLNRSTGFGRALRVAARHEFVAEADFLLLLHDDLAIDPYAVRIMVEALVQDPGLGIVGPKLREWTSEPVLQEVGMTIDRFGRAESRVERGELDQGHLDSRREVLYVNTAGMLVRSSVLADLQGFDLRFPALRDDLDLCWRAWLLGWRVEVIPDAIGYHVAAGTRGGRSLWRDRAWQTRFLSERHGLATILKNYSWATLIWVLPLTMLLGVAKLVGFAMTRRFSDIGATLRAYAWNVLEFPRTLVHRRRIQRARRRGDAELRHLFATGMPRLLEYIDALRDWLAGSDAPTMLPEQEEPPPPQGNRLARLARERPAFLVGGVLAVVYVVSLIPLLGRGQLIGGTVLPWPASPGDFLASYASPVSGGPLATDVSASPAQAVLGLLGYGMLGNAWLAQTVLVFGLLPLAWLTALRAGRLVTARRGPRMAGATLYALSPVMLGTLAQGRLGELVAAALFPAVVLLTARVVNPKAAPRQAWRASAWLALSSVVVIAAAPGLWLVIVPVLVVGLAVALVPDMNVLSRPVLRMLTASAGALGLLAPWLWDLARAPGSVLAPAATGGDLPAWRALTLTPMTFPGAEGSGAYFAVAVTLAVLVLALLLGLRLRPLPVTALMALMLFSATLAWTADRLQMEWVWAPALLLPGSAALAGLGVLAARTMGPALRDYTFGLPQVAVLATVVPLLVGLAFVVWSVPTRGWPAFDRGAELVPAYVAAEADRVGPYRIVLLEEDPHGGVRWGVTEAAGPSMLEFGAARSSVLSERLEAAVAGVFAGNLESGAVLGAANVRYVVLTEDAPGVVDALRRQPDLEPMVAGSGRVFRVGPWLPRAAVLPTDVAEAALDPATPVDLRPFEDDGLHRTGPGIYEGEVSGGDRAVVISEEPGLWRAGTAGAGLAPASDLGGSAHLVPPGIGAGTQVIAEPDGRAARALALVFQVMVLFGLVSLLLRPPGLARASMAHLALHEPGLGTPWERSAYDDEPSLAERLETLGPTGERR